MHVVLYLNDYFLFLSRITPPFHTSSPEHERYTPPSERRRGRLFDEDGFVPKNVVGPRNLLEVKIFLSRKPFCCGVLFCRLKFRVPVKDMTV